MRNFFLTILIFILMIVFLFPDFINFKEYERINTYKNKSIYFP